MCSELQKPLITLEIDSRTSPANRASNNAINVQKIGIYQGENTDFMCTYDNFTRKRWLEFITWPEHDIILYE